MANKMRILAGGPILLLVEWSILGWRALNARSVARNTFET
jgi:hypothetical protein